MKSPRFEDVYELSPMQQGILFHTLYDPAAELYLGQHILTVRGELDNALFAQAWQHVAARHAILRTSFHWEGLEKPVQVVHLHAEVPVESRDWRGLTPEAQQKRLDALVREDRKKSFDLTLPPLLRVGLFRIAEDLHECVVTSHHLLLDRWSLFLVLKEVFSEYAARRIGQGVRLSPAPAYGEFIAWIQGKDRGEAEAFWRSALAGLTRPTSLSFDNRSGAPTRQDFEEASVRLSPQATARLQSFARRHRLTLNTLVAGAWSVLASRYSGEEDVLFGATVSGRPASLPNVESIVGLFINTLPVRVKVPDHEKVIDWLQRFQDRLLEMREHEHSSLVDIQGWSEIPRGTPLFESIVVFENVGGDVDSISMDGHLRVLQVRSPGGWTNYPLTLTAVPGPQLFLQILADRSIFDTCSVTRMLGHLTTLLESMAADPEQPLSHLPLLTAPERHQLLSEWNRTGADYPKDKTVNGLFEEQVERTPDAVAAMAVSGQLTYRELNAQANQLAHHLRGLGAGPEVSVGICMERSPQMLIGLLGILKSGAAYVPIDPAYPQERLAFLLEDSGAAILVTQEKLAGVLPQVPRKIVKLDADRDAISRESDQNPPAAAGAHNVAYVIYTSGSTGKPKGVEILHQGLVNYVTAVSQLYRMTPSDRVLQFSSLSFDSAADEVFIPLSTGATVVLRSDEMLQSTSRFLEACRRSGTTVLVFPTAYWHELVMGMAANGLRFPKSIRLTSIGGEGALVERLLQWREVAGDRVRLWNGYGPTETTIAATFCDLTDWLAGNPSPATVPIGKPIANVKTYVLDPRGEPRPIGAPGELYIGGAGLARGYRNLPAETDRRFVASPLPENRGERLYRTGDVARFRSDGNLEFLGRRDDQVKVRGFRIELGEIESALAQHPSISDCAVIVREDVAGEKRLIAYVAGRGQTAPAIPQLRSFLKRKLPDYMLPSAFVALERLPLTTTGKLDRRALPEPGDSVSRENVCVLPRNPVEEVLAGIWGRVLKRQIVGVEDDFFSLGGHSLIATQVISRMREAFGVELPLRALFETPTIAGLAKKIASASEENSGPLPASPVPLPRSRDLPLSFAQQRLWFLDQFEPGKPFYNVPLLLRLSGELDVDSLERALDGIVARHESLRTWFESTEGRPVQKISETVPFLLTRIDLDGMAEAEREAAAAARIAVEVARPFDLTQAPLLRTTIYRINFREHLLLVTMHHIVSDGWSMGIFVKELAAFYEEFSGGPPAALPPLPIQYADFAVWQREWLGGDVLEKQLAYWKAQLADLPVLELPTDMPRPGVQSFRGARRSVSFSKTLMEALKDLSRREGVTLYMVLLAAFQVLLSRYSDQEDIVVGSPIAGRTRAEIEGLIGFFINTLVLRTDLSGDPSFRELLRRVREAALGAYEHQDLPFEKLVEELQPERDLTFSPLFQVLFAVQNAPTATLDLPGVTVTPLPVESKNVRFDLEAYVWETPAGLTCTFVYATDLFDSGTIVRMMGHYQNLLEEIVRDGNRRVSQLPILSERERRQVLEEWNQTASVYPREMTVPELFERQVARAPQAEALVCGRERLTYGQLEERSNRLARYLIKLGVGPEVLVGVCVERSVEMVMGLLGILKAGGAYVPLDPSYPSKRLAFMLEDTGARVVLTQESLLGSLPDGDFRRVRLDADWGEIARERGEKLERRASSQNLAYVIFTSGSTGRPKGVAIEHRSAVALLAWAREAFSDAELGGVLASTSICFDLSVFELFAPLASGGKVILAQSVLELAQLSAAGEVKLVNTVPSAMGELLRIGELPESVETVNLAGEPLAAALVREILRRGRVKRVLDLYGPTEDTTYSTCARRSGEGPVTIGRPISNKRVYILDAHLGPVPVGIAGNLYVAGAGIARGYLNRPELTAQTFLADPFRAGQRMYQTGDRARFLPDGSIQFLGRLDHQVKIRGYRIEMGEIEEALARHPRIRVCAVVARQDPMGSRRLVAYVVPRDGEAPTVTQLRDSLKKTLPDYMVPTVFAFLQALPLTPNGKVDRQALPAPEQTRPELEDLFVPPRNPVEQTVAGIWRQVLGLEKVGIHDNFFELGGHSLLATRVFARLQKAFPLAPSLRTLFEKPTVAELSTAIEDLRQAGSGSLHSPVLPVSRQALSPEPPEQEPSWTATTKGPLEND